MKCVGILPTISNEYDLINSFIKKVFKQTKTIDLLVVIYQGTKKEQKLFKEKIHINSNIHIISTDIKSLTYAKNRALDFLTAIEYDYCFIYEDDLELPYTYNENMIDYLIKNNSDMISSVQLTKINFISKIRAIIYIATHIYPFNDKRSFYENFTFDKDTFKSRFLYGGLSMYKKSICNNFRYDENLTRYSLGEDIDFSYRVSKEYKTIITNAIKAENKSLGTKKFGYENYFKSKISMWKYIYNKNMKRDILSLFSFSVLIFGIFLESIFLSIIKFNLKFFIYFIKDSISVFWKKKSSNFIINSKKYEA